MSTQPDTAGAAGEKIRRSIWDNDLPAGDSPPLPAWPLKLSIIAYALWFVFLLTMMILRLRETG